MKKILIIITAIFIAIGGGISLQKYLEQPQTQAHGNPVVGSQRIEFAAVDLNGELRNINEWHGKLIFLNFWATWCPPCKKEIPDFIALQAAYGDQGLQFIGIAIDNEHAVAEFAKSKGINYPTLVAEADGVALAKRYGNTLSVLPYTVIINREGEISDIIVGELSKIDAKKIMEKHGIKL